ncbi:MAG: hypothetical protein ACFE8B_00800 [Candidatus Hermodarchaeota archaeon]
MKKINKILIGAIAFIALFTVLNTNTVLAAESPIEVNVDTYQYQVQANHSVMFSFRQRTRLTFASTVDIDANINCDALRIGVKYFEIEIDNDQDLQMNMTCTEEQIQLGLLKGYRYTVRNRQRLLYQEGFCVSIQCNNSGDVQAKLKIQANNQNRKGTWAYYDDSAEEWVAVPTTIEDGYLVTETDHFSYWTILNPESENNFYLYIGLISVIGILAVITVVLLRRRT